MDIFSQIRKSTYQDSMKLMRLQAALNAISEIVSTGVAMGTAVNKKLFEEAGLLTDEIAQAGPNDVCIAIKASSERGLSLALEHIANHFNPSKIAPIHSASAQIQPKSISSALAHLPHANLAVISVPGAYAAFEGLKALKAGLHVFMFSDNVPLEDEFELKQVAEEKGLLMMGPDCGTSIIAGVPLGLANNVRRGKIGIVGASGSGIQEVSSLIHMKGDGISQAIGTGGRDLQAYIGGKTFLSALKALIADPETEIIVLMSKHCDQNVVAKVMQVAEGSNKFVVAYFLGGKRTWTSDSKRIYIADNLEHVASCAVALSKGENPPKAIRIEDVSREMKEVISSEVKQFSAEQRYMRALFAGGTFMDEAEELLSGFLKPLYGYPSTGRILPIQDPLKSRGHCIVDLGEDYFTKGKLHPIIDPSQRIARIRKEIADHEIRVFLIDVVLGYGSYHNPAGPLADVISETRHVLQKNGRHITFVVSLCGTNEDPQNYEEQKKMLEKSGAIVSNSCTKAIFIAGLIAA